MAPQNRRYQTQWASQFFAAAELTRRGCLVTLTFGNAKFADLMVETPGGKTIFVDVKGQSGENWWIIRRPELKSNEDRYFILAYVPKKENEAPMYSILSSKDMSEELERSQEKSKQAEIIRGKPYAKFAPGMGGMDWSQSFKPDYKDRWDKLPK